MSVDSKVETLHTALTNKNEKDLIDLIMTNSRNERVEIRNAYDKKYQPQLMDEIAKRFSGEFKDLVKKLFLSRAEFDTQELLRSFKAFSTDEDTIYDILLNRPQKIINEIRELYSKLDKTSLEKNINKCLDRIIKDVVNVVIKTERNTNSNPDKKECQKLADLLINQKPEKWLTDKKIVNDIIAKVSPEEMVLILRFYKEKTGNHVQNMVDKLPKTQKKFLTSFLFNVISPAEHYAYTIYQSLKGIGTNNQLLDRVLATRYDLDMPLVKQFYYDIYKVTAKEDIEDDTSEYYRELLIELLNYMDENDS